MAVLIDSFNRANANLEASTTASGGGTWVHDGAIAGAATISSNALAANTADGEGSLYSADLGSVDQAVSFVLKNTTANSFVVLRCTDRQNYVGVRASGANLQIFRRVAGSFTQVYSAAHSITANDVIEARVSGTQNIEVLRNGSSLVSMSIGATLTGTRAGVHPRQAVQNPFVDDFSAQPLAATQTITGALFSNANGFYGATVDAPYTIAGALYSDADTFYGSTIAATNTIAGALYSDPDTFFAATVTQPQTLQTITGQLYANDNQFFQAAVTGGGSTQRGDDAAPRRRLPAFVPEIREEEPEQPVVKRKVTKQVVAKAIETIPELPEWWAPKTVKAILPPFIEVPKSRDAEAAFYAEIREILARKAQEEADDEEETILLMLAS